MPLGIRPSLQPARTQRRKQGRRRVRDSEDEADGAPTSNQGMNEDDDQDRTGEMNNDEVDQKARDLVRLALFTEYRRVPLKREEISKRVLGSAPRAFRDVLERAQGILRNTFGMELIELQSRAELEKDDTSKENATGDRRKATGMKKKGKEGPKSIHR